MPNIVLFPVINLTDTGRTIERCRKEAGLSVRDVQNYFGFEYPQAVYKWQHGECLPSVDNLLALARLLQVKMEDLLVYEDLEVPLFFGVLFLRFLFSSFESAQVLSGIIQNASSVSIDIKPKQKSSRYQRKHAESVLIYTVVRRRSLCSDRSKGL